MSEWTRKAAREIDVQYEKLPLWAQQVLVNLHRQIDELKFDLDRERGKAERPDWYNGRFYVHELDGKVSEREVIEHSMYLDCAGITMNIVPKEDHIGIWFDVQGGTYRKKGWIEDVFIRPTSCNHIELWRAERQQPPWKKS